MYLRFIVFVHFINIAFYGERTSAVLENSFFSSKKNTGLSELLKYEELYYDDKSRLHKLLGELISFPDEFESSPASSATSRGVELFTNQDGACSRLSYAERRTSRIYQSLLHDKEAVSLVTRPSFPSYPFTLLLISSLSVTSRY